MLRAPEAFLREVFVPEFDRMFRLLEAHLEDLTRRVVADVLSADLNEPREQDERRQLDAGAPVGG